MPPRPVTVVVCGLGSVGSALLRLVAARVEQVRRQHGVRLVVVGVVDSRGAALDAAGLDVPTVLATKEGGASVGDLPDVGVPGADAAQVLSRLGAAGHPVDVVVEAGPADLRTGGAGLAAVLAARAAGAAVVLANKAPLALAWEQVVEAPGPAVRYSACVGAALPTVDLLRSVAVSASPVRLEVVLNSTCQRVLGDVEAGLSAAEAVAAAQAAGLAEADPYLDVDGTDTAVKLVVLMAALGHRVRLDEVSVTGVREVTADLATRARERGEILVLMGTAVPAPRPREGWTLEVAPVALPRHHPLARMDRHETGLVVHTDVAGTIAASGRHEDVTATAAAVLRDVLVVAGTSTPHAPRP